MQETNLSRAFYISNEVADFSSQNVIKFWSLVRPNINNVIKVLESRENWVAKKELKNSEVDFFSTSFKQLWTKTDPKELIELMLPFLGSLPFSLCLFFLGWLEVHGEVNDEGISFVECCTERAFEIAEEETKNDNVYEGACIYIDRIKALAQTKALYSVLHKTANLKQIKKVL